MVNIRNDLLFYHFFLNDKIGDEISWLKILHLVYSNSSIFTKLNN